VGQCPRIPSSAEKTNRSELRRRSRPGCGTRSEPGWTVGTLPSYAGRSSTCYLRWSPDRELGSDHRLPSTAGAFGQHVTRPLTPMSCPCWQSSGLSMATRRAAASGAVGRAFESPMARKEMHHLRLRDLWSFGLPSVKSARAVADAGLRAPACANGLLVALALAVIGPLGVVAERMTAAVVGGEPRRVKPRRLVRAASPRRHRSAPAARAQ
jgi:hypothetical protein